MTGRLKLATPPATEPVLPADLKTFGRIPADVADATLTPLIIAAREAAEEYLNRALITQSWDMVLDGFPCGLIHLPRPPLISLTSVTVTDVAGSVTAMNISDFVVDTSGAVGSIALKYGKYWPSVIPERAGVVIRYSCGYGDAAAVPQRIKTAIIYGALWQYDHPGENIAYPQAFYDLLSIDRIEPV